MEMVSLNCEPVFEEGDEYEDEGECTIAEQENETHETQKALLPAVGLEFESFDGAYDFYNIYAKEQGFGIRVSNSWFRSKRKERYRAKLSCSNAGFKKKSGANHPRPETRTGCPAMIVIKLVDSNRWRFVEVELQHNHPVNPETKRFYKSHKKMIQMQQSEPVTEVHTIKLYRTAVTDAPGDGNPEVKEREGGNPVNQPKHLDLKEGDAQAMYNYFCRMKLTNPNFFYLTDLDDDGHLRNVFWADAKSRAAYTYFSDIIAIDTTSLTNKYEIPLISFVGLNHHGQSVLLGCGFLGNESVEHFAWIFKSWLTSMLGRRPQVIITDQSKPLLLAVSEVFPQAQHCYCLSYIMQRVPEKLGGLKGYELIKRQLSRAVYNSLTVAEFESFWREMIVQHGLGYNKWLQLLYEDRQKWVPVYLNDILSVGMIPIKENETVISFFDGYVHKNTTIKEFVDRHELALQRKNLREAMADYESRNSTFELKTKCNFELQLSKVYTKNIFKNFQTEVEGMFSCFHTRQVSMDGPIVTFIVKERVEAEGGAKEVKQYKVLYETTHKEVRCICSLFNFRGFLCRHALTVLNYNGLEEIPSQYILARWHRDFKRKFPVDFSFSDNNLDQSAKMYANLQGHALRIVEEGALSEERYRVVLQELEALLSKFSLVEDNLI